MAIEKVKKQYEEEVDVVIVVGTGPGGSNGKFVAARYENGLLRTNTDGGANAGDNWWRRYAQDEITTNERENGVFKIVFKDKPDIRYTDQVNATITDENHPKGPRYGFPDKLSDLFPEKEEPEAALEAKESAKAPKPRQTRPTNTASKAKRA